MRSKIHIKIMAVIFSCAIFALNAKAQVYDYRSYAGAVSPERQASTIRYLSSLGSRVTGLEGADKAASYITQKFHEIGLQNVHGVEFPLVIPVEKYATLEVAGKNTKYRMHSLWPNLVNPSTPEYLKGPLIYAGKSQLYNYNKKEVDGAVVLLDFNCGGDWLNAFLLGAKAVIFIEPRETLRGETEKKYLSIPLNAPRFWISRSQADSLLGIISSSKRVEVQLKSKMVFEKREGRNIFGMIPGTDPNLKDNLLVVEAYYDAISVVPEIAPGAEDACGISALLEAARMFRSHPPKQSVLFLASSGHFQGLTGMKHFIRYWKEQKEKKGEESQENNLALDKPAKSSSREPAISFVPKSAFDGDLATKWSSALRKKDDEWITVDLKDEKTVSQVVIRWDSSYAESFVIMTSLDGEQWETASLREKGREGEKSVTFKPRKARYVKMQQLKLRSDRRNCSISEFEIYSKPKLAGQFKYPDISMFISLDLSSHSSGVGAFYQGFFYERTSEDLKSRYSGMGMNFSNFAKNITSVLGETESYFANGINPIKGRSWKTFLPSSMAFNSEIAVLAGITGITLASTNDIRPLVDTPLNTIEHMNIPNLCRQTKFINCMLYKFADDPLIFRDIKLPDFYCRLEGKVVYFDPTISYIPDTPLPGALVVARGSQKVFTGVKGDLIDISTDLSSEKGNDTASFEFLGLPSVNSEVKGGGGVSLEAYRIDEKTSAVTYAPDYGAQGSRAGKGVEMNWSEKEATIIVFDCVSLSVFDLVDQRFYRTFQQISVFDGKTNSEPTEFGYSFPMQNASFFQEPVALAYGKVGESLKVTMGSGLIGTQFTLLNSNESEPLGIGYKIDFPRTMTLTPYKVASDMWMLNEWRMDILRNKGIENNRLDALHALSLRDLKKADSALIEGNYEDFIKYSRSAWGFESRAYPDVRKTGDDVVKGVLFYLFLLLPFAYFLERLFFAFPDIRKQIVGTFALFLIVFALLRFVHPAFDITLTPFMVLLAFITLTLAVLVIAIIMGKFDELFKEYKKRVSGVHTTDVGRISATATAFSLGVSNMRKRKGRTGLTTATLIMLTFTVLSFTSVKTFMSSNKLLLEKPATYEGMLFRDRNWEPLEETTYKIINTEFRKDALVSPRCWYYSEMTLGQSSVDIAHGRNIYTVTAIAGMSPEEFEINPSYGPHLKGRWFKKDENDACILSQKIVDNLGFDIGSSVNIFGMSFKLIGIIGDDFKQVTDLDEEEITPVNYVAMSDMMGELSGGGSNQSITDAPPQKLTHLMPHEIAFLPFEVLMNLGGQLRSVAVGVKDKGNVKEIVDNLMPRLAINLFVGEGGKAYYCSSIGRTSFSGLPNLFIPILIAAFIVLNTMLGSVYERVREIGIYSAVGLAPSHIAALFLAEACVYATIGSVSGYLLGQGVSKIVTMYDLLPGLTLNYSSLSATATIGIVIAMVILSSVYPATKASKMAVPTVERKWKLPEPVKDLWHFELPFTVTGEEAKGINAFMKEFFDGHTEYSLGDFYTEGGKLVLPDSGHEKTLVYTVMIWLAPFDLGVSQEAKFTTTAIGTSGIYNISLDLLRKSGDITSWKRTNSRFVNHVRKQLLLWRTMLPEKRQEYAQKAEEIIAKIKKTA